MSEERKVVRKPSGDRKEPTTEGQTIEQQIKALEQQIKRLLEKMKGEE